MSYLSKRMPERELNGGKKNHIVKRESAISLLEHMLDRSATEQNLRKELVVPGSPVLP